MFETIFRRRPTIARHEQGPMAEERRRYLAHLAERGTSPGYLYQKAEYVYWVARMLKLTPGSRLSPAEIDAAAERWAHRDRPRQFQAKGPRGPRRLFRMVAREWLRFLDLLALPSPWSNPYAPLVRAFGNYMEDERGLSPHTIAGRCWFVCKFLDRIVQNGQELRALNVGQIDEFLAWQGCHGYSRRSIATYVSALRSFFKYGERQGWCRPGVAVAIAGPRLYRDESLPVGPSWADVRRLLATTQTNRPTDIRDRAILLLFATYGLRAGEVRGLRLDDLDWDRERIILRRPKQRCADTYPLVRSVGNAILRYLTKVRPRVSDRSLFLTLKRPYRPLGCGAIWPLVGERLRKMEIALPHSGPHCLRHSCASRLLAKGFSLKQIADHFGHRSLETTRIYAKVDLPALRRVANFGLGGVL